MQLERKGSFWRSAAGDPTLKVVPERAATTPGVTVSDTYVGQVVSHEQSSGSAADFILSIQRAGGDRIRVYYRLGRQLRLPFNVGEGVKLEVVQRRHAEDEGLDVGLLGWRTGGTQDRSKTPAVAAGAPDELVVVIQTRDILEQRPVPTVLRALRATDIPAYHESGTYKSDCEEIRAHHHFRVSRPKWIVDRDASASDERLLAPGTSVTLDDGTEKWRVQLLDNRKVENSTCVSVPEPTWSWVAVAASRVASTVATQVPDGSGKTGGSDDRTRTPRGESEPAQ